MPLPTRIRKTQLAQAIADLLSEIQDGLIAASEAGITCKPPEAVELTFQYVTAEDVFNDTVVRESVQTETQGERVVTTSDDSYSVDEGQQDTREDGYTVSNSKSGGDSMNETRYYREYQTSL